jgi:hypothetical protein
MVQVGLIIIIVKLVAVRVSKSEGNDFSGLDSWSFYPSMACKGNTDDKRYRGGYQ